jgi:hypothetical protein
VEGEAEVSVPVKRHGNGTAERKSTELLFLAVNYSALAIQRFA